MARRLHHARADWGLLSLGVSALLLACVTDVVTALSGQFVCTRIETYKVPVTVTENVPYVVREMVWCLQVPPRCPQTRILYRVDNVVVNITKTRVISECCAGYKEQEERCVPQCSGQFAGCGDRGQCVAPDICKCDPGFHGATCNQGYDLVTTEELTSTRTTKQVAMTTPSTKHVTTPSELYEDGYHGYDNEINSDLSHISIPDTSQQEASLPTYSTQEAMVPTETSIVKPEINRNISISVPTRNNTVVPISTTVTEILKNTQKKMYPTTDNLPVKTEIMKSTQKTTLPTVASKKTSSFVTPEMTIESSTKTPAITMEENSNLTTISVETSPEVATKETPMETSTMSSLYNSTIVTHILRQSDNASGKITLVENNVLDSGGRGKGDQPSLLLMYNNGTSSEANHHYRYLFDMDLVSTVTIILGAALSVVLVALLVVLICQYRLDNLKDKAVQGQQVQPQQAVPRTPSVIHSQLPPTPDESCVAAMFCPANNKVVILQHVTMATTNNTFKPAAEQPTISPALREALEAHYDHPPTRSGTMSRRPRDPADDEGRNRANTIGYRPCHGAGVLSRSYTLGYKPCDTSDNDDRYRNLGYKSSDSNDINGRYRTLGYKRCDTNDTNDRYKTLGYKPCDKDGRCNTLDFRQSAGSTYNNTDFLEAVHCSRDNGQRPPDVTSDRRSEVMVERASSLAKLWDAVVSEAAAQDEEEHVYDEIPCWRSPVTSQVTPSSQDSRC